MATFLASLQVRFEPQRFTRVLWHEQHREHDAWGNFRFTAKNSVEHISPQNPQATGTNKVTSAWLNRFGNLALVSRSINSEYSNLPYNEKRQRFLNKRVLEKRPDSLKMDLIYSNSEWGDAKAEAHQTAIR
ncbi:HNH endonuclease family protein [Pseudomonas sp. B21-036]|uniref:HNH endonuclease family protein n=1 Tax=unclassified Pseudomonas TaxID=196821 RepID=UPI00216015B6|nr:HNH endonuclease family protein [Pseudomonas sp. B21-036]UVL50635.1 HNH endonuclease family protein [Pseudomonas sp. B21-036]